MQRGSFKRPPMKIEATPKNVKGLDQKTSDETKATQKNTKVLIQKTSDEKRGNPKKHKGAHSKLMKKRQPQKTQRGSFKRPPKEKEAIIAKV
jgi:hypothetical protein